jgi:hypothetical protein
LQLVVLFIFCCSKSFDHKFVHFHIICSCSFFIFKTALCLSLNSCMYAARCVSRASNHCTNQLFYFIYYGTPYITHFLCSLISEIDHIILFSNLRPPGKLVSSPWTSYFGPFHTRCSRVILVYSAIISPHSACWYGYHRIFEFCLLVQYIIISSFLIILGLYLIRSDQLINLFLYHRIHIMLVDTVKYYSYYFILISQSENYVRLILDSIMESIPVVFTIIRHYL